MGLFRSLYQGLTDTNKVVGVGIQIMRNPRSDILSKRGKDSSINILGNGPSLRKDLTRLDENLPAFCVNHFADLEDFERIKPAFYLFLDPYFWESAISDLHLEMREKTFRNLALRVSWPMTILVPSYSLTVIFNPVLTNLNIKLKRYNAVGCNFTCDRLTNFFWARGWAAPYQVNVVHHALYLSLRMGFGKIYLYGVDTTAYRGLEVDSASNEVYMSIQHAYGEKRIKQDMSGKLRRSLTMEQCLLREYLNFRGYRLLRDFAASIGVNVYNFSTVSMLDSFPRRED